MKESHFQQGKYKNWNYEPRTLKMYTHVSRCDSKGMNGQDHIVALPAVSAFSLEFSKTKLKYIFFAN